MRVSMSTWGSLWRPVSKKGVRLTHELFVFPRGPEIIGRHRPHLSGGGATAADGVDYRGLPDTSAWAGELRPLHSGGHSDRLDRGRHYLHAISRVGQAHR